MNSTDNNGGWVKLHRSILEWEWWDEPLTAHLFLHCIVKANHTTRQWRGITIERGTFLTSVAQLSSETGLTTRQVRTSINRLISTNEVTSKTTNKYTIITICNFDYYQNEETESDKQNDKQNDKQATSKRQASDKQATTNKNDKNERIFNISHSSECAREFIKKGENGGIVPEEGIKDPVVQPQQAPTPLPPAPGNLYDTTENHYARYRAELTAETMTSDAALRLARGYGKTLTREQLGEYLDRFQDTRRASGDTHTTHSDYRRHFTSWLRTIIEIETRQQQNTDRHGKVTDTQAASERPRKIGDAAEFTERL